MTAYVWEYIPGITHRFHDGGGLLIVSGRDPNAAWMRYLNALPLEEVDGENLDEAWKARLIEHWTKFMLPEPTTTFRLSGDVERVFVFPNAGCC